nr:MAG TPA: hypothetical protein [Caudoviricetes sp.]
MKRTSVVKAASQPPKAEAIMPPITPMMEQIAVLVSFIVVVLSLANTKPAVSPSFGLSSGLIYYLQITCFLRAQALYRASFGRLLRQFRKFKVNQNFLHLFHQRCRDIVDGLLTLHNQGCIDDSHVKHFLSDKFEDAPNHAASSSAFTLSFSLSGTSSSVFRPL